MQSEGGRNCSPWRWLAVALAFGLGASAHGATIEQGWAAYEAGNYDRAYELFHEVFTSDPASEPANFGLGMAALMKGKLSHALFAFERVLMMNPENQRARLELARTYVAMEQYELARDEFESVLKADPPENVRENIRKYLDYIHDATTPWTFNGLVGLSAFHDDNVNYGPASRLVETVIGTLEVDSNSLPVSASGVALAGTVEALYDAGRKGHWLAAGGLLGYRNWMGDAPDQEIGYVRASVGARRLQPRTLIDLPAKIDYFEFGPDPLVTIVGAEPSILFAPSAEWQFTSLLVAEYRDYDRGDVQDGPCYRFTETAKRLFAEGRNQLSLKGGWFYEDADAPSYANQGPEASLSGEMEVIPRLSLYGVAEFRRVTYDAILLADLQESSREDDQVQFVAGARYSLSDRWTLDANYRRVDNKSNFGLYDYERNVFTVSTFLTF